jgi:hypothetical protein
MGQINCQMWETAHLTWTGKQPACLLKSLTLTKLVSHLSLFNALRRTSSSSSVAACAERSWFYRAARLREALVRNLTRTGSPRRKRSSGLGSRTTTDTNSVLGSTTSSTRTTRAESASFTETAAASAQRPRPRPGAQRYTRRSTLPAVAGT